MYQYYLLRSSSARRIFCVVRRHGHPLHSTIKQDIITKTNIGSLSCCSFSTTSPSTYRTGDKLRVAIVGGGVAGLSTALHLAPLVQQGIVAGPIDIYDQATTGTKGRDIGVGVWSTALDSFQQSPHDSHQLLYKDMTALGTFIEHVGYRTPKGHWLTTSTLPTSPTSTASDLPSLLFLREVDMLSSLRKALHIEEHRGNVQLKTATAVQAIHEQSKHPWSSSLVLTSDSFQSNDFMAERDYHLIVAADGMDSVLRKTYGGHLVKRKHLTGTTALPSPLDLPVTPSKVHEWDESGQAEATATQDRQYTVFRGHANMTLEDIGGVSFQTWGEGKSMRFACVPMNYWNKDKREQKQVWFITINDDTIQQETDPIKRRDLLLDAFGTWHDPIRQMVLATPPEEILMERAMAHKHCMSPVGDFNRVVSQMRDFTPPATAGRGPAIVFVGDAFMCVDPILAQGFTIGMEGAAALAHSIQQSCTAPPRPDYPNLAFDPFLLRQELKSRHDNRLGRLIHLLRATEIVQALGQPTSGTLSGLISRDIIRPLMRLTPNFITKPIFNAMLKYSLGVPMTSSSATQAATPPPVATTSTSNSATTAATKK